MLRHEPLSVCRPIVDKLDTHLDNLKHWQLLLVDAIHRAGVHDGSGQVAAAQSVTATGGCSRPREQRHRGSGTAMVVLVARYQDVVRKDVGIVHVGVQRPLVIRVFGDRPCVKVVALASATYTKRLRAPGRAHVPQQHNFSCGNQRRVVISAARSRREGAIESAMHGRFSSKPTQETLRHSQHGWCAVRRPWWQTRTQPHAARVNDSCAPNEADATGRMPLRGLHAHT